VLIITRRPGEKIIVGDDVVIEVIEVSGSSVRVGIQAPKSIPVYREEIWQSVKQENAAAAAADPEQFPSETHPTKRN
jgi:carbon storage regulator